MPTSILPTHTCSFELRWFEESAPTSPPIHGWHLWITGSILYSAKWTCNSTTCSWRLQRILTRFAPTSIPSWVKATRRRILNSQVSCGTRSPPDGCHQRGWQQYRSGWTTKAHIGKSSRRDDDAVTRRPLPQRQIYHHRCQCQDTART